MLLMVAEAINFAKVAGLYPDSPVWQAIKFHTTHVEWRGCSLHDMIQPTFSFLVGTSLVYSLAARRSKGTPDWRIHLHAAWRALLLVALGVFLRSHGRPMTRFTFEDTLSQIGLGYFALHLVGCAPRIVAAISVPAILVGYWALFALWPLPGPEHDWAAVGVPANWSEHGTGFALHWNRNANPAWAFDTWFLNLFPREEPFKFNGGGYSTLSFISTLATMILGIFAGRWIKEGGEGWSAFGKLVLAGVVCLGLGLGLDATGICPSVKKIWTPAWTLHAGGITFLMLAGFHLVGEKLRLGPLLMPLVVIGANSIAVYFLAHAPFEPWFFSSIKTHIGPLVGGNFGPANVWQGVGVVLIIHLIATWMYRRRIFIKV
jgi:predicted acyltransferase